MLAFVALFSLRTGSTGQLTTGQVLEIIFSDGGEKLPRLVVRELRVPRVLLGMLIGAALGLVGVILQDTMLNALAEPGLLGTSSGAVLVVAVVTVFDLVVPVGGLPVLAFAGGLVAGGVLLLAASLKMPPVRLILVGAALNALLNSLLIILISLGEPFDIQLLYRFMVGSLANRTWDAVHMVLPWLAVGIPAALLIGRPLNLLRLGEDVAESLGLPVLRARVFFFALSTAMVAAAVAVAGPISFVALLAPHAARRSLRSDDARMVLPVAALIGALLLTVADLVARQVFHPVELPVGLFTIVLGAPVLLILLRREIARSQST
jgi:iron complex transport system permease protein